MNFDITVANPGDLIGVTPSLSVSLNDANSKLVYGKVSVSASDLVVLKPSAATAVASYLVSYGIAVDETTELLGAGVYADPLCMTSGVVATLNLDGTASNADAAAPW